MNLEGGAYLNSGNFKCIFDNKDFIKYVQSDGTANEIRCFRNQATIIAEERELDKEQAFVTLLTKRLAKISPYTVCFPQAVLATIPTKRYTLTEEGVAQFRNIAAVSRQRACAKLFDHPTKLQAVCMGRGVPLAGPSVIQTLWKNVRHSAKRPLSPSVCAPAIGAMFGNVCLALKILLEANMLHGDIKVNNILLFTDPPSIRRYELFPDSSGNHATDIVGTRNLFQLIDFGKYQTHETFLGGGFRRFTRKTMRQWYNPLCLGILLMHKDSRPVNNVENLSGELARWLPEIFPQMDKYAFMFTIYEVYECAAQLGWEPFKQSLVTLLQTCATTIPNTVARNALERVREEKWVTDNSPFQTFMIGNGLVWFKPWHELYRLCREWTGKWAKSVLPETLEGLARQRCPQLFGL